MNQSTQNALIDPHYSAETLAAALRDATRRWHQAQRDALRSGRSWAGHRADCGACPHPLNREQGHPSCPVGVVMSHRAGTDAARRDRWRDRVEQLEQLAEQIPLG